MMLKEEKHTAHAVAFSVDIPLKSSPNKEPKIKKRLEADALAAKGPSITLDQIKDKLIRAELKRKLSLESVYTLNRKDRERSKLVNERKASLDHERLKQLNGKYKRRHEYSDEKRTAVLEQRIKKAKIHLEKVEEIRQLKNKEKELDINNQRNELENKLENAEKKRDHNLE